MDIWQNLYTKTYSHKYKDFCNLCLNTKKNLEKYDIKECEKIIQKYYEFFQDTLSIFQNFFLYNNLHFFEKRTIVPFILKCEILENGYELYDLYVRLIDDDPMIKNKIKDLLQDKYIKIFIQLNDFLKNRIKTEEIYGTFD